MSTKELPFFGIFTTMNIPSQNQFSSVQSLSHIWFFVIPWTTPCQASLSMPGLSVHHQLLEFIQILVHGVSGAIQPSHPLSSPSPPALNLSQHQRFSKWVSSSHQVSKVLEFQLQHQSFQRISIHDYWKNHSFD